LKRKTQRSNDRLKREDWSVGEKTSQARGYKKKGWEKIPFANKLSEKGGKPNGNSEKGNGRKRGPSNAGGKKKKKEVLLTTRGRPPFSEEEGGRILLINENRGEKGERKV